VKHSIVFKNTDNHWDNGLPLGNGCFGAMVYFEKGRLFMPMNHYEVYYNKEENVLPEDMLAAMKPCTDPGGLQRKFTERADMGQPPEGEAYTCYRTPRAAFDDREGTAGNILGSHPKTGDLIFSFGEKLYDADEKLMLLVEDARSVLTLKGDGCSLQLETVVSREDCIINRVSQSDAGLLSSLELEITPQRTETNPADVEYKQTSPNTFVYTVTRKLGGKTFVFSGVIRLVGAEGELVYKKHALEIRLTKAEREVYILTGIFTEFRYLNTAVEGIKKIDEWERGLKVLYADHSDYWKAFFERSSINIPDKFLEHVYYINQYALDCCSGKDGVMKHHACGLNGLWDVRRPTLWGSMWYWDVNIQAAFAGVYSSNRLELAKVFSDGLLTYVDLAKRAAHDVHNMTGIAGDYPYNFYYSVWPWCAQYLWFLYEYSLDKDYLEKDAFPVFEGLCEFYCQLFRYDERRGYYSVYPDISPEQGPLAHDTVITVASVKYLFKFTLEAAKILGKNPPILEKCREIMNNMAPYPISEPGIYGVHLKDSADAPDNMWIRHPSMLMPVFPIGELDIDNDKRMWKIVSNTVDFLEDRAEIGIFGGSWIAAAAARLGRGQTALRLLYERGIDHMLRTNGLTAEKTDRFTNYCLTIRQPIYYPCMMEFTGEMLAALNEMLINSDNGLIKVFPAIPDGDPEYGRLIRRGVAHQDYHDICADYEAWKNVRFDKLLCKGAFEVSAALVGGKLDFIKVYSKKGGRVRITSPFMHGELSVFCGGKKVDAAFDGKVAEFDTSAGEAYIIAASADVDTSPAAAGDYSEDVLSHLTYTKRMIYLGEDSEAKYRIAADGSMRDWYFGNVRIPNQTMYKFDFTNNNQKTYSDCLPRQCDCAEERPLKFMGFFKIGDGNLTFTDAQGYGFVDGSDAVIVERGGPDLLRQDFASGTSDTEFIIEAPRGQYELFVVSGDCEEDSMTVLSCVNGLSPRCTPTKKGEYQCKLIPVINEDDEPIKLKVSTLPGYRWKINYIILNGVKGYN